MIENPQTPSVNIEQYHQEWSNPLGNILYYQFFIDCSRQTGNIITVCGDLFKSHRLCRTVYVSKTAKVLLRSHVVF